MQLEHVLGNYTAFLKAFFKEVTAAGFDTSAFAQLDHLCYRTTSIENYEAKKEAMSSIAQLLSVVKINGRSIATFRLNKPLVYEKWRVDCIELAAPKFGNTYPEGLEHGEFVLFDDFATFQRQHLDKQFDLKALERGVNPEIGYKLPSCGVKFHLISLAAAVYLEKKLGIKEM